MLNDLPGAEEPPFFAALPLNASTDRPLLHTKLRVPGYTPTLLARTRLTRQLQARPNGCLTLVAAPAGFGKTTLVADWAGRQTAPVAWLTVDEQDNDPVLFWRYLIAALQGVDSGFGQRSLAVLSTLPRQALDTAVTELVNDLAAYCAADRPLLLVIDDYHWIYNGLIHKSLDYLLRHQPPQLQVVLLTRADPPLSLARLRVEGRLVELRAAELRLTQPEVTSFIAEVMDLQLLPADLQLLLEETEGWAAGLQLAALYLRYGNPDGVLQLRQSYAGIKQHIFAYLVEEVLRHQTSEMREFLQQTAVLRQFCAPLCTAVTGTAGAADLLQKLVADNYFITALDAGGQWYRYHPLFAELLRAGLDESAQRECHRRAARWYEAQGLTQDALRNASAAGDYELMAALLTRTYKAFLADGLLVSLQKWLSAVPTAYVTPRLRLATAWCRVYEIGETALDQIISEIGSGPPAGEPAFKGEILAVRAVYASLYGRLDQSVAWANEALTLIDSEDYLSLAAAYQALGNAYRSQGLFDAAIEAYTQGQRQFAALGNAIMAQLPLYRIASIRVLQGRLHQAWEAYERLRQNAQAAGYEPLILAGEIFGYLSDLFLEWYDLDKALDYARQEIDLAQSGHMLLGLVDGYLKLAAVSVARGDQEEALHALGLAVETADALSSAGVTASVVMQQVRCELSWGNLAPAVAWAGEMAERRREGPLFAPLLAQSADLLLARVWLAQRRFDKVLELLAGMWPVLKASGRVRLQTEALVLRALAYAAQGQKEMAGETVIQALELAKPEGYIHVFVENGRALAPLLYQVRPHSPQYVDRLLGLLPVGQASALSEWPLIDALTEREQEILSLIACGYSNRQIAADLHISVGTVKGHVNHIFSKLDVRSRTQALVRARQLNLIS
ncbi:MAG: LuxR C-terminal-related transcriptional regulator [Candidatus Promineifilaceae bacterium]